MKSLHNFVGPHPIYWIFFFFAHVNALNSGNKLLSSQIEAMIKYSPRYLYISGQINSDVIKLLSVIQSHSWLHPNKASSLNVFSQAQTFFWGSSESQLFLHWISLRTWNLWIFFMVTLTYKFLNSPTLFHLGKQIFFRQNKRSLPS